MNLQLLFSLLAQFNWHGFAFWLIAGMILAAALYMVLTPNIVRSVVALIFTFFMMAGIYLLMAAEFIALIQILIYAGAVSVLIVFSVMMVTDRETSMDETSPFSRYLFPGALGASALFVLLLSIINTTSWNITYQEKSFSDINEIATGFLTTHVVAFEVAAVLLLVALVAAIAIIKGVTDYDS